MTEEQWKMIDKFLVEKGYINPIVGNIPCHRVYRKEYEGENKYTSEFYLDNFDRYFSIYYKISEKPKNGVSFSAETSMNFERKTFTEKTLLKAYNMLTYRMFIHTGGIYDST